MNFRTEIHVEPSVSKITYASPLMFTGSCFTENIGQKLKELLFPVMINPFGVVYNPLSVIRGLDHILKNREFTKDDLFFHNEHWNSWDHHSSFSSPVQEEALQKINMEIKTAHAFLKKASFLVISLGTAWVYKLKDNGNLVCNCHRVPAAQFNRELLTAGEIVFEFLRMKKRLEEFNPDLKVILTVSPVRHWKDGANGNQVSKATLLLAIHQLRLIDHCSCEYFPAYEIVMDDLRDYRFFSGDLLHPNEMAIEYIWEKFSTCYFDDKTRKLSREIEALVIASRHRFYNEESQGTAKFRESRLKKIAELRKNFPEIDFKGLEKIFS